MRSLRSAGGKLEQLGTSIVAVSADSVTRQKAFAQAEDLPFSLIADENGSVARQFGVWDQERGLAKRITFIIDPTGIIRFVDQKVNVATHGEDLVKVLKSLQKDNREEEGAVS